MTSERGESTTDKLFARVIIAREDRWVDGGGRRSCKGEKWERNPHPSSMLADRVSVLVSPSLVLTRHVYGARDVAPPPPAVALAFSSGHRPDRER